MKQNHKERYFAALEKIQPYDNSNEYQALLYILTCDALHDVLDQCFDFEERIIKPEVLQQPWQTGSSVRMIRMAFNLFTSQAPGYDDEEMYYRPSNILSGLDLCNARILIEAMEIYTGLRPGRPE